MIKRILDFSIRKDITKKNKKINHAALLQSMFLPRKVSFLAMYHKKKLIFLCLAMTIMWTYDLHKPLMRKILAMRSPLKIVESWVVEEKKVPNTILEQSFAGIQLKPETINLLVNLYVTADPKLHFGVGRYFMFQVYKDLKLIETDEEIRKFWASTGFYKERNQKASGVGLAEFLIIFEQGLQHERKKNPQTTQEELVKKFTQKFIQKIPEVMAWQREFNKERNQQFLKNMPGDNEKKKDVIIEVMREHSLKNKYMLTESEMESKIVEMGLKGLNLTDKALYWELKRTWDQIRVISIEKKMSHPLTTPIQKVELLKQKSDMQEQVRKSETKLSELEEAYEKLYQHKIF